MCLAAVPLMALDVAPRARTTEGITPRVGKYKIFLEVRSLKCVTNWLLIDKDVQFREKCLSSHLWYDRSVQGQDGLMATYMAGELKVSNMIWTKEKTHGVTAEDRPNKKPCSSFNWF